MFQALCKKAAKSNRGFTLIELIVVIAILGILIAILVPSMIGFVNSAKEASVKAEAKTVYTAVQAYLTNEVVVKNNTSPAISSGTAIATVISTLESGKYIDAGKIKAADVTCSITVDTDKVTITSLVYTKNKIKVTYPEGKVEPETSPS